MSGRRIHAAAPVRLDFAGGWTDVEPFAGREGGTVVNAAIELRVHARLEPGGGCYAIESEDLGQRAEFASLDALESEPAAALALHRAALRRYRPGPCVLRTRSDVPLGSGLGSSGALGVALVAACAAAAGRRPALAPAELAEEAFQLEAVDAELPGGRQDQYAAAFGGFHRLGFRDGSVAVERLEPDPALVSWLEQRLIVCYTGTSRASSRMISRVMGSYQSDDPTVSEALRRMADLAEGMAEAFRAGDRERVIRVLRKHWLYQQGLDPQMVTPEMHRLEAALGTQALAGKAAGAGAGGSMFFLVSDPGVARQAAERAGARVLPFRWAPRGVTVEELT